VSFTKINAVKTILKLGVSMNFCARIFQIYCTIGLKFYGGFSRNAAKVFTNSMKIGTWNTVNEIILTCVP
jgi:hypothetical protein